MTNSQALTLVNIETAWNVLHQLKVGSNNSFVSVLATTDIATYCVRAVQLSVARFGIFLTLIDVYAFRFDPCKTPFASTSFYKNLDRS